MFGKLVNYPYICQIITNSNKRNFKILKINAYVTTLNNYEAQQSQMFTASMQ